VRLRKSIKSFKDAEYNFRLLDRQLRGHGLDDGEIRTLPSHKVTGDLEFYSEDTLRLSVTDDRIQMFTSAGHEGGFIVGQESQGRPSISMISPWQSRVIAADSSIPQDRYSIVNTRVDSRTSKPPTVYLGAVDITPEDLADKTSSHVHLDRNIILNCAYGAIYVFGWFWFAGVDPENPGNYYTIRKNGEDGPGIINFICEE